MFAKLLIMSFERVYWVSFSFGGNSVGQWIWDKIMNSVSSFARFLYHYEGALVSEQYWYTGIISGFEIYGRV